MVYNFVASTPYLDLALVRLPVLSKYSSEFYRFKLSKRYLFKYACSLGILLIIGLSTSLVPLERNPNIPAVWRTEVIIKLSFLILLVFNICAIWFVRLETKLLRYIVIDFAFCVVMCSYQVRHDFYVINNLNKISCRANNFSC